jgi:hypothetical protein
MNDISSSSSLIAWKCSVCKTHLSFQDSSSHTCSSSQLETTLRKALIQWQADLNRLFSEIHCLPESWCHAVQQDLRKWTLEEIQPILSFSSPDWIKQLQYGKTLVRKASNEWEIRRDRLTYGLSNGLSHFYEFFWFRVRPSLFYRNLVSEEAFAFLPEASLSSTVEKKEEKAKEPPAKRRRSMTNERVWTEADTSMLVDMRSQMGNRRWKDALDPTTKHGAYFKERGWTMEQVEQKFHRLRRTKRFKTGPWGLKTHRWTQEDTTHLLTCQKEKPPSMSWQQFVDSDTPGGKYFQSRGLSGNNLRCKLTSIRDRSRSSVSSPKNGEETEDDIGISET